jgi:Flp pilus assembly protein TadD/TolB-like protein
VSFSGTRAWLLVPLLLCGCSARRPAEVRKIAIPPFENLSAEARLDWLESGFGEMLRLELTGSPRSLPVRVARAADAIPAGAAYVVRGYYFRSGGRLRVEATLEDLRAQSTVETASASAPGEGGAIALGESIARQIDPAARPAGTRNPAALEAMVRGDFPSAAAADPDFGAAYVAWAQSLVARRETDKAREVIATARARAGRFPAVERDLFALAAASLDNDAAGRRRALIALSRSTPADPFPLAALAEQDFNARAFPGAAVFYRQALERDPDNVAILNQLGYAEAYAGDLASAVQHLTRYRDLRPREANPLDSLGDVNYYAGRFAEAEKYYLQAHARDATFLAGGELYKAAWARLMRGDLAGADALFAKYMQASPDALAPYRRAQWEYLTGRRREGMARLAALDTPLAAAQLAIWQLETGDPAGARRNALRAGAAGPGAIVRYVTMPQGAPPPGLAGEYASAYALLYSKQFRAAGERLRALYARTPPGSGEPLEVLLAWTVAESGDARHAAALAATNVIPDTAGAHLFLSLSFPRILFLRGDYKLFLQYSGDLPTIFGEEARARAALAGR